MRLFTPTDDNLTDTRQNNLTLNSHADRMLLTSTETIVIIISTSIAAVLIMTIFGYIYYRKFFANRKEDLTEEEMEEEREQEMEKLRKENQQEWEAKRFAKMRYVGNSDFYSWQLIKKVKIIEGMSQDIKAVKKITPESEGDMNNTRADKKQSQNQNNEQQEPEVDQSKLEKKSDEKGAQDEIEGEDGNSIDKIINDAVDSAKLTEHESGNNLIERSENSKLPKLNNNPTNPAAKETEEQYELKPIDTQVSVFYVNAQRTSKTPGRMDLENSRRKLDDMDEEEANRDHRYRTGMKQTHPANENTEARTTHKNSP